MKKASRYEQKELTIAELCEALARGTISAQIKNGEYIIRRNDLARLAHHDAVKSAVAKKPVFTIVGVA